MANKHELMQAFQRIKELVEEIQASPAFQAWQQSREQGISEDDMWRLVFKLQEDIRKRDAENAAMRALLEERTNQVDTGVESLRERNMFCFYCGGWTDYKAMHGSTVWLYMHKDTCWWLRARAFLAEHPQSS